MTEDYKENGACAEEIRKDDRIVGTAGDGAANNGATGDGIAKVCPCCGGERHKERSDKEYRDLITRLNRIEGQIRGIRGMVEGSAYCIDILIQVSAATSALNSFSKQLLQSHIKSCVAEDIREGNEEKLDELIKFLPKMMK